MWFIAAVLFLVFEIAAPGIFFIWISLAAALNGLIVLALPDLSPASQSVMFAALAIVSTLLGRRYFGYHDDEGAPAVPLNVGGARHIGRVVEVTRDIRAGEGRVRLGDTEWLARGPDAAEGTMVRIVGADGPVLIVEPAKDADSAPSEPATGQ
ncbi:MAG: NfeD family protein [Alphaproteobacteria bacterium]|nr:MAG: NfeD family protein [Alphaproteobacteria bacterium]